MKIKRTEVVTTYYLEGDDVFDTRYYPAPIKRGPRYRVEHRVNSESRVNPNGHWQIESYKGHYWQVCNEGGATYKRVLAALQALLAKEAEAAAPKSNVIDLMDALRRATEGEK